MEDMKDIHLKGKANYFQIYMKYNEKTWTWPTLSDH